MVMVIRLNEYLRNEVRKELLRGVFLPKLEAMFERIQEHHKDVHAAVYPPEIIKKAEAFYAACLKSGFRKEMDRSVIDTQVGGQKRYYCHMGAGSTAIQLGVMSYHDGWTSRMTKLPDPCSATYRCLEDDPLGARMMELFKESDELVEEMKTRSAALAATLDKFKTLKQVAEHWPEVLPIFEKYAGKRHQPANALVEMSFGELNEFYKLPPEPVEELAEAA